MQCITKLYRNKEEHASVPTVRKPVLAPFGVSGPCKDRSLSVRRGQEREDLVKNTSKENKRWLRTEWLSSPAEPFNDVKDAFWIASLVRATCPIRLKTRHGFKLDPCMCV